MSLLDLDGLSIALPKGADRALAVEQTSFAIEPNEIVCLVGESGSGKSMIAHAILGLLPPKVRPSAGRIGFGDRNILDLSPGALKALRGSDIAMIFQEPLTALNPLKKVGEQVAETIRIHAKGGPAVDVTARIEELFAQVGLPDPARLRKAFPFQLSG
ncbi:MAG: ATP-binding cassette domain-containing protein, partial [Pseudomonadota bacterium]|nr:ATP-binding cassette domain-containing protein [Pseudomonadota bacterium]